MLRCQQLKHGGEKPLCDVCSLVCAGPGSKRLGIDGDREAIPLTLQIAYSKVSARGRCSRWGRNHFGAGHTRPSAGG